MNKAWVVEQKFKRGWIPLDIMESLPKAEKYFATCGADKARFRIRRWVREESK